MVVVVEGRENRTLRRVAMMRTSVIFTPGGLSTPAHPSLLLLVLREPQIDPSCSRPSYPETSSDRDPACVSACPHAVVRIGMP